MSLDASISYLLQGAALGITAAAAPGTFQTYLINQSLIGGWRRGAPVAFSPLLSDPPIVVTILLLLDWLPAQFIQVISLLGGIFVFYLVWGFWREWRRSAPTESSEIPPDNLDKSANIEEQTTSEYPTSTWKVVGRGALMNVLSPGPYTFWTLVIGPLFLSAIDQAPINGLGLLVGFYSMFVGGLLAIVGIFHLAHKMGPRVVRALTLVSIIILVIFGGLLLAKGLGRL